MKAGDDDSIKEFIAGTGWLDRCVFCDCVDGCTISGALGCWYGFKLNAVVAVYRIGADGG